MNQVKSSLMHLITFELMVQNLVKIDQTIRIR